MNIKFDKKRMIEDEMDLKSKGALRRYAVDFELSFLRKQPDIARSLRFLHSAKSKESEAAKNKNSGTVFEVAMPFTVAVLGRSKTLFDHVMASKHILDEYESKQCVFTMVSLLDFCCRFEGDAKDRSMRFDHGLNIQLHHYQRQSLRWMVEEERDPIGFYRHFYRKGFFNDDSAFLYSAVFEKMLVNDSPHVAHGGFLCEEMVCYLHSGYSSYSLCCTLCCCMAPCCHLVDRK